MSTALATKLDRKSLRRPDEFIAQTRKLMQKLASQSKLLVVLGGVLVLIALGFGYWMSQSSQKEMEAQDALFLAKKKLASENSTAALEGVAKTYPASRAAFDATLALGDQAMDQRDFAAAQKWYEKAASNAPASFEKALSFYSLGYAFEGAKDYAGAAKQFEKALNQGQASLKAELLMSLARTQALSGKKDAALKTYDRLIAEHAKTEEADRAAALKAKLSE